MVLFEWTLALLLGAVLVAALARRLEVPYPALLALAGVGLAVLPFAPAIEIEPDLALALLDATALLIYRGAVAAVAGSFALSSAAPMLAVSTLGSLLAGYALARLFHLVFARVRDPASGTILQFVSTFGVWILAERIGLSAIITMVVYAMTLARAAPRRVAARNRISSYSVWETAVFVLNVL